MVVEKKLIQYNYSSNNKPIAIVIHETGNSSKGSDADAHYRYWNSRNQGSSAHYVVDENKVIQLVEHYNQSWHNGKMYSSSKATRPEINNSNSIGIEMCVNSGSDYEKTLQNAIQLVQMLMRDLKIGIDNVMFHVTTKGKNCPERLIKENRLDWFKQQLQPKGELEIAVDILCNKKIINTKDAWYPSVNPKYVYDLMCNYLKYKGDVACCYNDAIIKLYRDKIITDIDSWIEVRQENIKWLLINMSKAV